MELLQKVSLCGSIGLASRLACKDQQCVSRRRRTLMDCGSLQDASLLSCRHLRRWLQQPVSLANRRASLTIIGANSLQDTATSRILNRKKKD